MVNGLACFINLLPQAVSFVRGHFFALVKAWCIVIVAMCFIHVMLIVGFSCMLATEGTLLVPVRMIA